MYSTALSLTLPDVSDEQHASRLADAPLLSLYEAFAGEVGNFANGCAK
jgi:hypothetical protein